jgi:hypothetical protein
MRWFKTVQQIGQKSSVVLGDSLQVDGKSLRTKIGNKFCNVVGLILSFEGYVKESSAAAGLTKSYAWNILNSITLSMPGGPWCTQVAGRDLINFLGRCGNYGYNAGGLTHITDIGTSASDVALRTKYLIPLAPGFFGNQGSFDDASCLAGAVPGELFKSSFSGTLNVISALMGNWIIGTTASTLRVYAICAHTSKPIAYCPSNFQAVNSNESTYDLATDGRLTALQSMVVLDDAYSTLTAPTEPRLTVDDQVVQQLVSGQNLDEISEIWKEYKSELYFDDGVTLLVPGHAPHLAPSGRRFSVWGAREQQTTAVRYLYHTISEPEVGLIATSLALEGVPEDQIRNVIADYSNLAIAPVGRASSVVVSGVPAGLSVSPEDRAARAVVLDVTRAV